MENSVIKKFLMDCGEFYQDTWLECLPEEIITKIYKHIYDDVMKELKDKINEVSMYRGSWYSLPFTPLDRRKPFLKCRTRNFNYPTNREELNKFKFKTIGNKIKQIYDGEAENDDDVLRILDIPKVLKLNKTVIDRHFNEIKFLKLYDVRINKYNAYRKSYHLYLTYKDPNLRETYDKRIFFQVYGNEVYKTKNVIINSNEELDSIYRLDGTIYTSSN